MWCDSQFESFNNKIRLDATRKDRINSAIAKFITFCETDKELSIALAEKPFLQGSVATSTCIKPLSNDEFDVDVIYPFTLQVFNAEAQNPKGILFGFCRGSKLIHSIART
jgi:hypothetical protein